MQWLAKRQAEKELPTKISLRGASQNRPKLCVFESRTSPSGSHRNSSSPKRDRLSAFYSRSHHAVIRVYEGAATSIETHGAQKRLQD